MSHLIIVDEFFLDDFHGVVSLGSLLLDHEHFGVASSTDHSQELKVLQPDQGVLIG